MSHVEQSVTCLHCQKAHHPGFIWNFSPAVRVCFTCYREMGEDARRSYERDAARGKLNKAGTRARGSKEISYARKVIGILTLVLVILSAGACLFYKPLNEEIAEQRVWAVVAR
ncbi:MAG: hypothetical protein ABJF10_10815 [Chthoniobacter sp.]